MNRLFNGRYKVIKSIGKGGMSTVYLAQNVSLGTMWAIKVIEKKSRSGFDLLAEPNILKKLNHPALPRIIDIEEDSKYLYIVEDYIEGISLDKQLKRYGKFKEEIVIKWVKQLCDVLLYLHNQTPNPIIYRDMKPSNIIVNSNNIIKLIDFGIAREFKKQNTDDTAYIGTKGYAAPEQYGIGQSDARTDIYSLGITMYHLLTGISPNEPPYEIKKLRNIDSRLSEGIELIVYKCTQSNPVNRYQSVEMLIKDLNNIHTFNSSYRKEKKISIIKNIAKVSIVLFFSLTILIGAKTISSEKREKYTTLINQGYESLNKYEFDSANSYFEEAIRLNKKEATSYIGKAQIYFNQKEYEKCISYLEEIYIEIEHLKNNSQYYYLMGTAYYENNEYEKAYNYLEKASTIDESNIEYKRDLAVCLARLGKIQNAQDIINEIISNNQSNDVVDYINGEIKLEKGDIYSAIKSFKKSIEITKDDNIRKKSYIAISNICKEHRETIDDALYQQIRILEEAKKNLIDKDDIVITEALGEAYFEANIYEKSISMFNKLLDLGYDRAYIYRNIAIIHQQLGDLNQAENVLIDMKEKYSDDYRCYLQLAYVYLEIELQNDEYSRDYSNVLQNYNLAIQFAPEGNRTSDIIPLANKIEELKTKGWI